MVTTNDAYAITRNDIKDIKTKIDTAKNNIKKIDSDIVNQKITVLDKENILSQKKNTLRELHKTSNDDSLSYAKKLDTAKNDVSIAKRELKTANQKSIDHLNEKSQQLDIIKSLDSILSDFENLISSRIPNNRVLEISLSQTCITLVKNNMSSTCPDYTLLSSLDSSMIVSGEFSLDEGGFFHRSNAKFKQSHLFYNFDNTPRLIVDAPNGSNFGKIIIMPNFDNYIVKNSNISDNNSRTIYHDRFIDDCKIAYINSDKWELLIPDTIHHMRNGCSDDTTNYQEAEIIVDPVTVIDISQSPNYQYSQWLESVKESCKVQC